MTWKPEHAPRPYRVWLVTLVPPFALVAVLAFVAWVVTW